MKYLISSISVNQAGQSALNAAPPEVFQADYYYKTGKFPKLGYKLMGDGADEVEEIIPILFGDKVNDLDHTIDLSRLNDPKLSITYNLAATNGSGELVWDQTFYPQFSVIAHLIEGVGIPASKGYQSLRQIESYTPVNDEKRFVELKGTRPIKRIYTQLDKDKPEYGTIHSVDKVRLWGDNEAYIPFDLDIDDWQDLLLELYGRCTVRAENQYALGSKYMDCVVDKRKFYKAIDASGTTHQVGFIGGSGRQSQFRTRAYGGDFGTAELKGYLAEFVGLAPWSVQPIDIEKMLGMEHLDPTAHAPMYLEIQHVSNASDIGGPMRVHVEDLVTTY